MSRDALRETSDVDVVLVNFRSGPLLAAAVAEAQRWLGPRAAVTIVDNSPGDGAVEHVTRTQPDVRVIENAVNAGFAFAVNQAIRATSAPLVLLLNPDVRHIRGSFSTIERILAEDPDVAAVAPRLVHADRSLQRNARREPRLSDLLIDIFGVRSRFPEWRRLFGAHYGDWDYSTTRPVDVAIGAVLAIRRTAFDSVGLLDERFFVYAEETDWLVRAKKLGWKTIFTPEVEAVHEARASTDATEADLVLLLVESEHRYARKHFGTRGALTLRGAGLLVDGLRWLLAASRGAARTEHRRMLENRILVHLGRDARSPRQRSGRETRSR